MTVRVNKDSFNLREKLSELERPIGLKGSELMSAETSQEARDFISAGRKNLIINGDMRISQRYGFNNPQTATNTNNYYLDRFVLRENTGGALQVRQNSPGYPFDNAMQINVTTADTNITSSEYARIQYYAEGNDARAVDWGKIGSKDHLTLSFWVKTNAPGNYHVNIENSNSSSYFPLMVKKYTIAQSDEWQKVEVTFPPPGNDTFERGNGIGFRITWALAIGSAYDDATDGVYRTSGYKMATSSQRNFMDTVGNNFYLTGVQLEVGKNATDFEHRSIGEELALCQRYYETTYPTGYSEGHNFGQSYPFATSHPIAFNFVASDDNISAQSYTFQVSKRGNPTVRLFSANNGTLNQALTYKGTGGTNSNHGIAVVNTSPTHVLISTVLGATGQANESYFHIAAESEL